ncbi:MAG: putative Ig domain-containing protein [Anaerolineae bacterium]
MDLKLSKKRASLLLGQAILIVLAISNFTAEAATYAQNNSLLAVPTVSNGSFEDSVEGNNINSLNGWTVTSGDVDVMSTVQNKQSNAIGASDGDRFLDLADATITQVIAGFTPNQPYVLRLDYWGHPDGGFGTLADVKVLVDNQELRQGLFDGTLPGIHSKEENDWVVCNEFEFVPTTSSITLRFQAEDNAQNGLLIDNIRFEERSTTQPDEHEFSTLVLNSDGWRQLANWSFEQTISDHSSNPENTGPDNSNPHLCGESIPNWRVTRENTDRITGWANTPNGTKVMDVGGHGPGGIGQTITGLVPNETYMLEFYAARHRFWGTEDMVSHLWSNGEFKLEVVRTTDQDADDGYIREEVDLVSDSNGRITFELFSMNIDKGGNNAFDGFRIIKKQASPVATNPGDQASNNGDVVSLDIVASDSDEDELTYSASGLPIGLSINEDDGLISGTITQAGDYDVDVTVSDGALTDSVKFEWFVNGLPSLDEISDQLSNVGEPISLTVSATDPDDDAIEYAATGLPSGLSIDADSGEITGSLTTYGDYSVVIVASDSNNGQDSVSLSWVVNGVPILQPVSDQITPPGEAVNLELSATDPEGDSLDFASTSLPDGLAIDNGTGKVTGIVTKVGNYLVKVTVSDEKGGEDTETFVWSVNSAPVLSSPGNQRTAEGSAVNLGLTASDPENDALSYEAINLPLGLSIEAITGVISGVASKTDTYAVTIMVTDSNEGKDSITFTWEVYVKTPPAGEGDIVIFLPLITQ